MTLKEIALELLEKYKDAEISVIWEYSGDIENEEHELELECERYIKDIDSADVVSRSEYENCRNELCLKCGDYKMRHKGACDGCRWKE